MEYGKDDIFDDRTTQAIWNRQFEGHKYRVEEDDSPLQIITQHLYYQKGKFKSSSPYTDLKDDFTAYRSRWYFGEQPDSLKGTYHIRDFYRLTGTMPLLPRQVLGNC